MIKMLQIGMTVKVLPDAEYGGKYTGCVGVVKNYYSSKKKAGVELEKVQNDASSKGLFWFSESKVVAAGSLPDAMMEYIKADLNATFGVANHIRRSRQTGLPQIKKVIYSGPKTIILWADNTKTIVSCGEADSYNDEKTGKRELFIAQDGAKMNQWGVLQYFEEVQTKTGASAKADALLKLYDQKTRKLTIQNAFGDVRVRAGSAVVVALNLGDIVTNNYMVVNKVTHTFRGDEHMMELDLIGGEFIA